MGRVQGNWQRLERLLREERGQRADWVLVVDCGVAPSDAFSGHEGKGVVFTTGAPGKRGNFDLVAGNGVLHLPTTHLEVAHYLDESQPLSISSVPDILLTSNWPLGFHQSLTSPPVPPACLSALVASVTDKLSPRYHFAVAAGQFYARPAYKSAQGWASCFIGLGAVSEEAEWTTWAYELEIEGIETLSKRELMQLPASVTENPYSPTQPLEELIVKHFPKDSTEKQLYRFFASYATVKEVRIVKGRHSFARLLLPRNEAQTLIQATNGADLEGRLISVGKSTPEPSKPKRQPLPTCWFCLASPKCEERLIVEVYQHWYVAVPKGQMTDQHLMVVPIGHVGGREDCKAEAREELGEVLGKLRGKLGDFLAFEYGKKEERGIYHLYVNIVPLEAEQIDWLRTKFQAPLSISTYEFLPNAQLPSLSPPYTLLSINTASACLYQVLSEVSGSLGDPARALVCTLISKPGLADWRQCEDSPAEIGNTARIRHLLTAAGP